MTIMKMKVATTPDISMESRRKEIHQRLSFIGRFQESISPELQKWKDLEQEKIKLRQELKKYPRAGFAPKKNRKTDPRNLKKGVNQLSNGIYNHYFKR